MNCQSRAIEGVNTTVAFWKHIRDLCLDQFPCGIGSWNKSRFPPRIATARHASLPVKLPFRGGLPPPDEETAEALIDLLRSPGSPWVLPDDCSAIDQDLREAVVHWPYIKDSFILAFFHSLRLNNKDVTEVDAGLLKFPNLEELTLSTNHISTVDSTVLPPTLKVLELCGNKLESLKDLCAHAPASLQHLGLGHNCKLGSPEEQYLTADFWPNLVSLDLSYNNFSDLLSLLSKLRTLKNLRILVLQGNPLSLLPAYRGFTIDSLPQLCSLDDVTVTADKRRHYLGLSHEPELLGQYTKIAVSIGRIRGIPCPVFPEEVESGPEAPIITYSYYVMYEFSKGEKIQEKETVKMALSQHMTLDLPKMKTSQPLMMQTSTSQSPPVEMLLQMETPAQNENVHCTPRKPWAETIKCEYKKEHVTRDLVALKAYLLAGTNVTVVEEKIVAWPIVVTPDESQTKKGKGKAEKKKAEKEKAGKGDKRTKEKEKAEKGKKEKGKTEKGKDAGKVGNKKKKSPSPELRSDPPILKILGSGHVGLESLLAGELLVDVVCNYGVLSQDLNTRTPSLKEKDSKKAGKKDKKSKNGADVSAGQKTSLPAKVKGKKKDSPEGERKTPPNPPVPLSVEFQMEHMKWDCDSQILLS